MRVGGIELSAADVAWLEQESKERGRTRSDLARRLCERIQLMDARGRPRVITARIALAAHALAGRLSLRAPDHPAPPRPPGLERPAGAEGATGRGDPIRVDLKALRVHRVTCPSDAWHAAWRRALDKHHYLGAGLLCGAQLRYVVLDGEQVVAAVSFSASARHVAARDEHIGWSAAARQRNRHLVIGQSRFCLTVCAKNLASRVQALLLERVATDWQEVYGYKPVLVESYVDATRFSGGCYRASNWTMVGQTSGRGRQDRNHEASTSIKSIWVYPLSQNWQETLCVEPVMQIDPTVDWAETEWGGVALGDRRLSRRLVEYGRACFQRPTANLPQTCGSRAATKAAYRLLNHPEASLERFLSGHRETTLARAAEYPVVLAIQDTTSLNYSTHPATEGLGPIGSYGANATLGLEVHSTLLTNVEGTPLGLLDVNAWARSKESYGDSAERRALPTAEKESHKWIRGYQAANAAAKRLGSKAQVVVVGDREADMFDLFQEAVAGQAQLLVRAVHPRRLLTQDGKVDGYLWDRVRQQAVSGLLTILVPRRGNRPARTTDLELRYLEARVRKPSDKAGKTRSVRVFAIAATETEATAVGADRIEWLLLTTLPVTTFEAAVEKVRWYTQRWLIEVFHRTLKSGCRIEQRQSTSADTLQASLAIDAVVAWRVMALTKLGREVPDVPCSVFFEELEWKALHSFVHRTKTPPAAPPTLREAIRMVAGLGGFLGRKADGEPGTQTIWRGLERLTDITAVFRVFWSSA